MNPSPCNPQTCPNVPEIELFAPGCRHQPRSDSISSQEASQARGTPQNDSGRVYASIPAQIRGARGTRKIEFFNACESEGTDWTVGTSVKFCVERSHRSYSGTGRIARSAKSDQKSRVMRSGSSRAWGPSPARANRRGAGAPAGTSNPPE